MIVFFKRLLGGLKVGNLWVEALELASKQEYRAALKLLNQIRVKGGFLIEVNVLRADMLGESRQLQECYDLCCALFDDIANDNSMDQNTKRYVTAYVLWIANLARTRGPFDKTKSIIRIEKIKWSEIDLATIPKHWKSNCSLNIHPDWPSNQ